MKTTEEIFNSILKSSMFRADGEDIALPEVVIELCKAITAEKETNWSLGECGETSLDDFVVGAYRSFTQWHAGQESIEYAAMCALGGIMASESDEDDPGWSAFDACNTWFESRSEKEKLNKIIDELLSLPRVQLNAANRHLALDQFISPPLSDASKWSGQQGFAYKDGSKIMQMQVTNEEDPFKRFLAYVSLTQLKDGTVSESALTFDGDAVWSIYKTIKKLYPEFEYVKTSDT